LELNPMETKGMEGTFKTIHAHQHEEGDAPENWPENDCDNHSHDGAFGGHSHLESKGHEHLSKLSVSKRKSPKSQVGCSIRNS